jgi:hypothetical protein
MTTGCTVRRAGLGNYSPRVHLNKYAQHLAYGYITYTKSFFYYMNWPFGVIINIFR